MEGYSFTEQLREVLARAREEAAGLGHEVVSCEHLLLSLIRESHGVAAAVLASLRADPPAIEREVLQRAKRGDPLGPHNPALPYTSRAKKALELSMGAARELGSTYLGCEHLLLGLLAEANALAYQALTALGVTYEAARAETIRLLAPTAVLGLTTDPLWLSELGTPTGQLADILHDLQALRAPEDILRAIISNDGGARHLLEISGVDLAALEHEIGHAAGSRRVAASVRELYTAAKSEQQYLGDCAIATHHVLLAYLALRPAHGYRSLTERGVTHASVRALAERIFG